MSCVSPGWDTGTLDSLLSYVQCYHVYACVVEKYTRVFTAERLILLDWSYNALRMGAVLKPMVMYGNMTRMLRQIRVDEMTGNYVYDMFTCFSQYSRVKE